MVWTCALLLHGIGQFAHQTAMGAAAVAAQGCGSVLPHSMPNGGLCIAPDRCSMGPEDGAAAVAAAPAASTMTDREEPPFVGDGVRPDQVLNLNITQRAEQSPSPSESDSSNLLPKIREPRAGAADDIKNDEAVAKAGSLGSEAILSHGGLTFAGGYSSVEGPNVEVKVARRNIGGLNREIRSSIRYSKVQTLLEIGYADGNFLGSNLVFAPTLFDVRQSTRGFGGGSQATPFGQSARGINVHLGHKLGNDLSATANYRLSADSFSLRGKGLTCDNGVFGSPICGALGRYTSSVLSLALTLDKRDSTIDATQGFKLRLTQDLAGLGGSTRYARTRIGGEAFVGLGGDWRLIIGAEAGFMTPLRKGRIPLFDRFYNNSSSMRGFDLRGIGPKVRPAAAGPGQNVAIGGRAYYAVRTELSIPVGGFLGDRGLKPCVFVDLGSVFGARKGELMPNETLIGNSAKPRVAIGIGFTLATPAGNLRLDIARPIIKQSGDRSRMLSISFGTSI